MVKTISLDISPRKVLKRLCRELWFFGWGLKDVAKTETVKDMLIGMYHNKDWNLLGGSKGDLIPNLPQGIGTVFNIIAPDGIYRNPFSSGRVVLERDKDALVKYALSIGVAIYNNLAGSEYAKYLKGMGVILKEYRIKFKGVKRVSAVIDFYVDISGHEISEQFFITQCIEGMISDILQDHIEDESVAFNNNIVFRIKRVFGNKEVGDN